MARGFARCHILAWSLALTCLVLTLTFLKTGREFRQAGPNHVVTKSVPYPSTIMTDTRQSLFPLTGVVLVPSPLSFPPGSQVSRKLLPGGPGI